MPNGRLVKLEALKSDADDGYFVHCDADMRWVVHSTDAVPERSEAQRISHWRLAPNVNHMDKACIHSMQTMAPMVPTA